MKPEQVYSLLVEANPIPDRDALPDIGVRLHIVDTRSPTMPTQTLEQPTRTPAPRPRRFVPIVAAAVAVLVAGVALAMVTGNSDEATQEDREAFALSTVQEFYTALEGGDLAAIERLTGADEADSTMWAFNAVLVAAYPRQVTGCEAVEVGNSLFVEVACTVRDSNPVFVSKGVTQVVERWQVFDDGRLQWLPIETPGFSAALLDARDYLRADYPEQYSEACDPSGYAFGSINFNQGIALTPECAEVISLLGDEIAEWIRAGTP